MALKHVRGVLLLVDDVHVVPQTIPCLEHLVAEAALTARVLNMTGLYVSRQVSLLSILFTTINTPPASPYFFHSSGYEQVEVLGTTSCKMTQFSHGRQREEQDKSYKRKMEILGQTHLCQWPQHSPAAEGLDPHRPRHLHSLPP